MIIVPRMITMLARWETCELKAYLDSDGTWHIGYGHGNANSHPPFVDEHTTLKDEAEAMCILVGELQEFYVPQLTALLSKIGFVATDNQFCGLLDVLYNRGAGRLRDSLAFRFLQHPELKWYREWAALALVYSSPDRFGAHGHNALDALGSVWHGEPVQLLDMNAKGEVRLGLTLRRMDDAALFLTRA